MSAESVRRECTAHYLDESDPEQVIQLRIACDAAWLLDVNRLRPGPEPLSKAYLYGAAGQGLATYGGNFKQLDLHSVFARRYSEELLQLLGVELEKGNKSWLKGLFQNPAVVQYPIRHLVVMNLLGFSAVDFFEQLPAVGPYGAGPWPCLNPVSACRNNLLIRECTVRGRSRVPANYRKPIADFLCPQCGFMYSRLGPDTCEQDRRRMDWVREYGHAWEAELRKVWVDRKYNITQVASHLGVTRRMIRKQASRCGLVIAKPGQRSPQRARNW